jgi:hypothetical protein
VLDFEHPGTLINATEAAFVSGATVGSPMGRSLLSLGRVGTDAALAARYGGRASDWLTLVSAAKASLPEHALVPEERRDAP